MCCPAVKRKVLCKTWYHHRYLDPAILSVGVREAMCRTKRGGYKLKRKGGTHVMPAMAEPNGHGAMGQAQEATVDYQVDYTGKRQELEQFELQAWSSPRWTGYVPILRCTCSGTLNTFV